MSAKRTLKQAKYDLGVAKSYRRELQNTIANEGATGVLDSRLRMLEHKIEDLKREIAWIKGEDWDGGDVPESCQSYGQSGAIYPPMAQLAREIERRAKDESN